jgi:uncharacterized membrane protein
METTRTAQACPGFWNDDTRRLAGIAGGLALGGYIVTHPRTLKFMLALGAAELLRRNVPMRIEALSFRPSRLMERSNIRAHASITIASDPEHVYRFWRNFENAPKFMSGVEDVRIVSENVAEWRMRTLQGRTLSWVGETTEDVPGKRIGWRIIGSDVIAGSGEAQFSTGVAPGTTEVRVRQEVRLPLTGGGWISRTLMKRRIEESLRRLKQLIETGEVARIDGQPAGERGLGGRVAHEYVKPFLIPQ